MGVLYGYKNTLNYLVGLTSGFFLVMLLSGWISATLLNALPTLEPALRTIGAGYILYQAHVEFSDFTAETPSSQRFLWLFSAFSATLR